MRDCHGRHREYEPRILGTPKVSDEKVVDMTFDHDPRPAQSREEDPPTTLTGRTVLDSRSARVGTVTDVLFDESRPDWLVVKTGPLSGEHFVPLASTYVDADGRVIVPLYKAEIRHAPRARRDHVITPQAQNELRDYYGRAAA